MIFNLLAALLTVIILVIVVCDLIHTAYRRNFPREDGQIATDLHGHKIFPKE